MGKLSELFDIKTVITTLVIGGITLALAKLSGWLGDSFERVQIPKYAVVAFSQKSDDPRHPCPIGWDAYQRGEGRYVVGLNPEGVIEKSVGFKLNDGDNFPAGQHTHKFAYTAFAQSGKITIPNGGGSYHEDSGLLTGTTEKNDGAPVGTIAPYVQLLYCVKT